MTLPPSELAMTTWTPPPPPQAYPKSWNAKADGYTATRYASQPQRDASTEEVAINQTIGRRGDYGQGLFVMVTKWSPFKAPPLLGEEGSRYACRRRAYYSQLFQHSSTALACLPQHPISTVDGGQWMIDATTPTPSLAGSWLSRGIILSVPNAVLPSLAILTQRPTTRHGKGERTRPPLACCRGSEG